MAETDGTEKLDKVGLTNLTIYGDLEALGRTIYGEARGESLIGKFAVGEVISNRVRSELWFSRSKLKGIQNHTFEAVCRYPKQFSCWNENDPNHSLITDQWEKQNAVAGLCIFVAAVVIERINARVLAADTYHYISKSMKYPPSWTEKGQKIAEIGNHIFYRGIA